MHPITKSLIILAAAAFTAGGAFAQEGVRKYMGDYGPHIRQKVDLYVPAQGPYRGLMVWIHGGSWSSGDKSDGLSLLLSRMLPQGVSVLTMNYRLKSDGAFPNSVHDVHSVLSAIELGDCATCNGENIWTTAKAVSQGGVMVTGFSAGGYLAVMGSMSYLGTMESSHVRCVTNIAGPVDLRAYPGSSDAQKRAITTLSDGNLSPEMQDQLSPVAYLQSGSWDRIAPKVVWYLRYSKNDPLTQLERTTGFTDNLVNMKVPLSLDISSDTVNNSHRMTEATIAKNITETALHCLTGAPLSRPVSKTEPNPNEASRPKRN